MKPSSVNHLWDHETLPGNAYWGTGLVTALLLLAGQIIYFEGATLSRNPIFRSALENICQPLNCPLPAYKNPTEFALLQSSLSSLPDRSQLFRVVFSNKATFAQPYPNLELTLHDYAGNPSKRRVFLPQDYLSKALVTTSAILPDATIEISLNIAAQKNSVGGYTFELIY